MAADGGSVFWVGQPLTTPQKRIAGSRWRLMMGVYFWGNTADQEGKRSRAQ